jgi:metal-responsive CopG/Arc/MetJ family transcriptional regulator
MHDPRIITPIPPGLLQAVDDWRYVNRLPSRAEAIRRLLEAGVGQEQAKAEPPTLLKGI